MSLNAQLAVLREKIRPFEGLVLKGEPNLTIIKAMATAAGFDHGEETVTRLIATVKAITTDLKTTTEPITVGKVVAHPKLQAFIESLPKGPDFQVIRCTSCGRVMERDLRDPKPCHVCGFDWSRSQPLASPS